MNELQARALKSGDVPHSSRGISVRELLTVGLAGGADHRGSDVRLDTSEQWKPSQWPRSSINPKLWHWKVMLAFPWKQRGAHINECECRAAFATLRWRTRAAHMINSEFLHLLDSAVTIGVLTRKRGTAHCYSPW